MAFADAQAGAVIISGESPAPVTVVGAVTRGDLLGFSGGWKRALATVGGVVQARCVASEDAVDGSTIVAYFGTVIIDGDRFSGATAGGALYAAESTNNGMYTQTAPSTTGDSNKVVGYMLTETRAVVTPNANVDTVAS